MTAEIAEDRSGRSPLLQETQIGKIPDEWKLVRLGAITTESAFGPRFPATHYDPAGNFGTLRTTDITADWKINYKTIPRAKLDDQFRNHVLREGDLLVTRSGTCGVVCVFNKQEIDVIPGAFLIRFRLNDRADPHFVRLAMMAGGSQARIQSMAAGGVQKNLSGTNLAQLLLPLPPLGEQKKMAAILSSVDEAIEATQAVIDQLQIVKKAMMAELLTRGLPGRHTRFKQTEIGEVPEEWVVVPLEEVIKAGPDNGLYKPQTEYGAGTPIVRIDTFENGDFLSSQELMRVRVSPDELVRFGLTANDILINRVNSLSHLAKAAMVCSLTETTIFESNMMRFVVNESRASPSFVFRIVSSPRAKEFFLARAKQAVAQASVNQDDVRSLPVIIPRDDEQKAIAKLFDSIDERIRAERDDLRGLVVAKDSLMSVLLSGEVRVKVDEDAA